MIYLITKCKGCEKPIEFVIPSSFTKYVDLSKEVVPKEYVDKIHGAQVCCGGCKTFNSLEVVGYKLDGV